MCLPKRSHVFVYRSRAGCRRLLRPPIRAIGGSFCIIDRLMCGCSVQRNLAHGAMQLSGGVLFSQHFLILDGETSECAHHSSLFWMSFQPLVLFCFDNTQGRVGLDRVWISGVSIDRQGSLPSVVLFEGLLSTVIGSPGFGLQTRAGHRRTMARVIIRHSFGQHVLPSFKWPACLIYDDRHVQC
jgi:hypothetical protein